MTRALPMATSPLIPLLESTSNPSTAIKSFVAVAINHHKSNNTANAHPRLLSVSLRLNSLGRATTAQYTPMGPPPCPLIIAIMPIPFTSRHLMMTMLR